MSTGTGSTNGASAWSIGAVERQRYDLPAEQVVYLAETAGTRPRAHPTPDRPGRTYRLAIDRRGGAGGRPGDVVFIVLIGHGSFSGGDVAVQRARSGSQRRKTLHDRPRGAPTPSASSSSTRRVRAANSSPALSGENRTIITATKTARERNETKLRRLPRRRHRRWRCSRR